jgi:hypothetical protein
MKKKSVLRIVAFLALVYPVVALFEASEIIGEGTVREAENEMISYQVSIWLSWVVLVITAVYFKWTQKKNFFFFFTYAYLILAFGLFGYLSQNLVLTYDLPTRFEDHYTFAVLTALQNIIMAAVLTGFLQAGVWWFTRRWHRS